MAVARRVDEPAQLLLPAGGGVAHLDVVVDAVEDMRRDDLVLNSGECGAVWAVGVARRGDHGGVGGADAGQAFELLISGEVDIEHCRALW